MQDILGHIHTFLYLCKTNKMNIHPLHSNDERPVRFTYPFCYEPHPLSCQAAAEVQQYIATHEEIRRDADNGKMFGVLVVESAEGLAFLAAYSGLLAGRNDWPYFVPPVYDAQQPDGHFKTTEREISLTTHLSPLTSKQMSQELQAWLFHQYQLLNARGEVKDLVDIWQEYYSRPKLRQKYPLPPGGTGDCCAPKLLQYAYKNGLQPLAMAEFWWGNSPKGEVRQHGNYYPACNSKCKPILGHMLIGLDVEPNPLMEIAPPEPKIIWEDDDLVAIDKPSGMLSVKGKSGVRSAEEWATERYPEAMIVHRLDQSTSGILVIAKHKAAHEALQKQFISRTVKKSYVALLEGEIPHTEGEIRLPLKLDYEHRPRQMVAQDGRAAHTIYKVEGVEDGRTRIRFYPITGRTHQLRVHAAHADGLGTPIVGDDIYGTPAERLMLHAETIEFIHPASGETISLQSKAEF
jgi:tRNA pseudouridine32 synthase/23S rRNA pseudouridine746 synthase